MANTKIIAEAGVNHNGSIEKAHRLIDLAKEAGADVVKFQTWSSDLVLRRDTPLVEYQKGAGAETMYELVKKLELAPADFAALKAHCDAIGISFLSTAFDLPSLDFLVDELKMNAIKIPSGEVVNVPLLRKAAKKSLPIILSTGMCTLEEIAFSIEQLNASSGPAGADITVLQCTTAYPTPAADIHLKSMVTLRDTFGRPVGLSDHSEGFLAACSAVAMGGVVIEKHFTLDRTLPGPDHKASVDPDGLRELVTSIRQVGAMLGSSDKGLRPIERATAKAVRRSLVATRDIAEGAVISGSDLIGLRPEDGISVRDFDKVVGQAAWKPFARGEVLQWPASAAGKV